MLPTGYFVKFHYKENYMFIKRNFTEAICIIHFFRQELQILIINILKNNIIIVPYKKLVLINIVYIPVIKWNISNKLKSSKRNNNCFGSTGI